MNIIKRQEFKFTYYDVTVQRVWHYATGTPNSIKRTNNNKFWEYPHMAASLFSPCFHPGQSVSVTLCNMDLGIIPSLLPLSHSIQQSANSAVYVPPVTSRHGGKQPRIIILLLYIYIYIYIYTTYACLHRYTQPHIHIYTYILIDIPAPTCICIITTKSRRDYRVIESLETIYLYLDLKTGLWQLMVFHTVTGPRWSTKTFPQMHQKDINGHCLVISK